MPFSPSAATGAGAGSNVRRGGWTRSLLPFTTSKHTRKSRRRAALRDFLLGNLFTIGVFASILFFLFIVYKFGIPRPISSQFRYGRSRFIRSRKPFYNRKPSSLAVTFPLNPYNVSLGAAVVDLTTKDLYDKVEFKDVNGGSWKQRWRIAYKGNEWDSEKLKVFVVPHSHNNPGWRLTIEEYYDRQSRHILDTIVESLSKDDRRKFIWEEVSYLERWWSDASDAKRDSFTNLAQNGQLEIVGGGWVMNDEVTSVFEA